MTREQTQNDWYRVLSLSRSNAAEDLKISNEILIASDKLIASAKNGQLSEEQAKEISQHLVQLALQLSKNSKEINHAVAKLVGVI